ncbi:MAG: LysR family transcriptional regulator [Hyphomicrobiales bacterium]
MSENINILDHKTGRLDIQLLQSLLAVANSPTLSSAAESLKIPQPTMSLQIKRLEERAGCELFKPGRRGKPMRLSDVGERLVVHAKQILSAHNDAVMCMESVNVVGSVSIGIPALMSAAPIGNHLKRFKNIYQGTSLRVIFDSPDKLDKMLKNGEIDLRVVYQSTPGEGGEVLYNEDLKWVRDSANTLPDCDAIPIALPSEGHCLRNHILSYLEKSTAQWEETASLTCMSKIYDRVASGQAISAIPSSMLDRAVTPVSDKLGLPFIDPVQLVAYKSEQLQEDETKKILSSHVLEFVKYSKLSYLF